MENWKETRGAVGSSGKKQPATAKKKARGKQAKQEVSTVTSPSSNLPAPADYYEELEDDEVKFLRSYAECCSVEQAARSAGVHLATTKRFIEKPSVKKEMKMMQSAFRAQWRLSAAQAAGKHVQLMDKAEALLEQGEVKALASLAKMSEASLKATGHFDVADVAAATNVTVSINIGSVEAGASVSVELPASAPPKPPSSPSFIDITPNEEEETSS